MSHNGILNPLLSALEKDDKSFINVLDKLIKNLVKIVNNTEDLNEELIGFDDIYQTFIEDVNFDYWLEVSDGIRYEKGINPDADFKMTFSKELIIKILKGEISGTEEFMKGRIKIQGDFSRGLRYIKLFRIILRFLEQSSSKK